MRIISSFHDFYDGVQKLGQDLSLIYHRKEIVEEFKNNPFPYIRGWNRFYNGRCIGFDSRIIGFCGKIYPLILIEDEKTSSLCYTMSEVDDKVKPCLKERDYRDYLKGKYVSYLSLNRKVLVEFFKEVEQKQGDYIEWFLKSRSPIFIAHIRDYFESKIVYNCSLKQFKFYRVFDSYSAFQEISMWLGNLAVPLKPIPVVSDKDMIVAKSFDIKTSFRQDKSK